MTLQKPTIASVRRLYELGKHEEALQLLDEISLRPDPVGKNARWIKRFLLSRNLSLAENAKSLEAQGRKSIAVVVHLFHRDSFGDLSERLKSLNHLAAFYATGPYDCDDPDVAKFGDSFRDFTYIQVDNRGRDVRPFIKVYDRIKDYPLCLKVHTKKGKLPLGNLWRKVLFDSCFGSVELCNEIIDLFSVDPSIAIVGSYDLFKSGRHLLFMNETNMHKILSLSSLGDQELPRDWGFIAGTVFWFRPSAFKELLSTDFDDLFGPEKGSLDGEAEHAFERLFGLVPFFKNLKVMLIKFDWPRSTHRIVSPDFGHLACLPPSATLDQINNKFRDSMCLAGDINSVSSANLTGWCAARNINASRSVRISIDHNCDIIAKADLYRLDLEQHGICEGRAGFRVFIPSKFFDGEEHIFTLYDHESDIRITEKKFLLHRVSRPFSDLQDFFKNSYTSPEVRAPFVEPDYRVLSSLDGLRRKLLAQYNVESERVSFSVIMPVYNRKDYVMEAIDSVLGQCHSNLELIIVDDGSTDHTSSIISGIADSRVSLVRYDENMGVSYARNQGLLIARNEYIVYLDSDNTWHPHHLACIASALTLNSKPECFYTGQLLFIGSKREIFGYRYGILNRSLCANTNYIDLNCFGHRNYSLDRDSRVPLFDVELKRFVDWEFIMKLVSACRTMSIPIVTSFYNILRCPDSITGSDGLLPLLSEVRRRNMTVLEASDAKHCSVKAISRPLTIVIPSYGAPAELQRCIACIDSCYSQAIDDGRVSVIVVDNNSSPADLPRIQRISSKSWITLAQLEKNYGFTYAVNRGIELASPENDIVLLNNDAYLTSGSLEEMQHYCYSTQDVGMTVPAQILPPHSDSISSHVPFADSAAEVDVTISARHANIDSIDIYSLSDTVDLSFAPFFCVYIPRATINMVGMLDHLLGRHYRSDRIYCAQLRLFYQKRILFCPRARVLHDVQKSTSHLRQNSDHSEFKKIFLLNTWDEQELAEMNQSLPRWMPSLSEDM